MDSISVVIPTYNEEENIKNTTYHLHKSLSKIFKKFEIIIVDSNSKDKTAKIAQKLSKNLGNVKLIIQNERKGFGNGLREGYRNCSNSLVWYMDADCPYDLDYLLPALKLIKNSDAVIGYKFGKRESFNRWFFSKCYNILIKTIFRLKFKDINFSFKLLRRSALEKLDLKSDKWFIDAEILCELKRHHMKVNEIPIQYRFRTNGSSKVHIGLRIIMDMLNETLCYAFRKKN